MPANANQAKRGIVNNHGGKRVSRLADKRSNSNCLQAASSGGNCARALPASISFCNWVHWPISGGSAVIWLSVKINQRSWGGKAAAGTVLI